MWQSVADDNIGAESTRHDATHAPPPAAPTRLNNSLLIRVLLWTDLSFVRGVRVVPERRRRPRHSRRETIEMEMII